MPRQGCRSFSFAQGLTRRRVSDETIRAAMAQLGVRWKRAKQWLTSPDPAYLRYWGCAGHAIIVVYLADIVRGQGLSLATGALVVSTMSGVSTFTRFTVPILADRAGSKCAMGLCFFLQGLPIVLLFWAREAWHFYLFAVLFGIGLGGEMSAFPIINRQYYGNAPTGTLYGWQMLGAGIGMASGAFLGGVVYDLSGDYTLALVCSFVLSLMGTLSILVLPSTTHCQIPEWEKALPPEVRTDVPDARGRGSPCPDC
jgi:MFS family permease